MKHSSKKVPMPAGSLSGVLARKSHSFRMSGSMLTARALGPLFTTAHGNTKHSLKLCSWELGCLGERQKCFAEFEHRKHLHCHKQAGTFRCASCSTAGLLLSIIGTLTLEVGQTRSEAGLTFCNLKCGYACSQPEALIQLAAQTHHVPSLHSSFCHQGPHLSQESEQNMLNLWLNDRDLIIAAAFITRFCVDFRQLWSHCFSQAVSEII